MNKPISILIKETKEKMIRACNDSGLPPCILELLVRNIYDEIYQLANNQLNEDELMYANSIINKDEIEE